MVRTPSSPASNAQSTAYQVERPRVSDAVGSALQKAYAGDFDLPEEMVQILRRLAARVDNARTDWPMSVREPKRAQPGT